MHDTIILVPDGLADPEQFLRCFVPLRRKVTNRLFLILPNLASREGVLRYERAPDDSRVRGVGGVQGIKDVRA